MHGLILSAPSSGSGKTTVTLGLLRALARDGVLVRPAKSGPDYIDPRFHAAAARSECVNLDGWAMSSTRIAALAQTDDLRIIEGAMGLFDGASPDARGSTADLARILGLPVVLIIDVKGMGQSIGPLVAGFAGYDPEVRIGGVIVNNYGSMRHLALCKAGLAPTGIPFLGGIPRRKDLELPRRHLGLVQADEMQEREAFLERAADAVARDVDIGALLRLAKDPGPTADPFRHARAIDAPRLSPPAQRIAIAMDRAFAFVYPHMLADWRAFGAEILPFSPLANETVPDADFIYLPGGYPELFTREISSATTFMQSLKNASHSADIYGECGGYMVLGKTLTPADGTPVPMAGLLNLDTSFAERRLHLGYRQLTAQSGPMAGNWRGHEFHYSTELHAAGTPLFSARDADGQPLKDMGLVSGRVSGSYAHLIDRVSKS